MNIILWTSFNSIIPIRGHGAYAVASWIRECGFTVKVIDFCHAMTTEELVSITEKFIDKDTYAIGVSSTFMLDTEIKDGDINNINYKSASEPTWLLNAREVIEKKHKIDWIIGGSNSYLFFEKDWIKIHGYGEEGILKYLNEKSQKSVNKKYDIVNARTRYDACDQIFNYEVLNLEASRGCQFRCKFCRYAGIGKEKNTYIRSPNEIKDELLYNFETFGTTKYTLTCDTFNETEEKVNSFLKITESLPFKLEWVGYNRLDLISRFDQMDRLYKSGLRATFFGIESFNKEASRAVGKGWNGKNAKNVLLSLRDKFPDVTYTISLIVGLPGEKQEEFESHIDWLITNQFHSFVTYPLSINRTYSGDKSIFDMNAEKYGYRFPKLLDPGFWENDSFNILTANVLARKINKMTKDIKIAPAFLKMHLESAGYIPNTPYISFLLSDNFKMYSENLISSYKKNMLNS
jgi:hypothetical protein